MRIAGAYGGDAGLQAGLRILTWRTSIPIASDQSQVSRFRIGWDSDGQAKQRAGRIGPEWLPDHSAVKDVLALRRPHALGPSKQARDGPAALQETEFVSGQRTTMEKVRLQDDDASAEVVWALNAYEPLAASCTVARISQSPLSKGRPLLPGKAR